MTKQPELEATAQLISGQGGLNETLTGNQRPVQLPAALSIIAESQEFMAALFRLNSEIAGAQSPQQQQTAELTSRTIELETASENQLRYSELRGTLDQAAYNLDAFSKRTTDEQISAESNTARFSSVKVLQKAVPPVIPVSPT